MWILPVNVRSLVLHCYRFLFISAVKAEAGEIPAEIDLSTRVPRDKLSFVVSIGTNGVGTVVQQLQRAIELIAGEKEAELIQQYRQMFRTIRASSNAVGTLFDWYNWMWPGQFDL